MPTRKREKNTPADRGAKLRQPRDNITSAHRSKGKTGKGDREQEEKYRSLFERASDAIYVIDLETRRIIDCNPKASEMSGYSIKELLSLSLEDLYPVQEQDIVSKIFLKVAQKEFLSGISGINQLRKDGTTCPVEISASKIDVGGRTCCMAIVRDISQRKHSEDALKKSEEKYRALFKHMFIGCALHKVITDENNTPIDYVFMEVNDAFERLTGLKRAEIIGKKVTVVIPGIEKSSVDWIGKYGKVALQGGVLEFEQHSELLNRWYSITAYRTMPGYFMVLFEDITERKGAEERLIHAEEEWERTFDTIPDLIAVMDNQHRIVKANRAMVKKLGIRREDLIGQFCYKVIHNSEEPPTFCPHSKTIMDGKENVREIYENNLKGYYLVSASPIFDSRQNPIGVVEVARDITARKKLEEELKEAAITDELTGLFNRRGFLTLIHKQSKLADRTRKPLLLLYLDIDNMKFINDEYGHQAGDKALEDTAEILKKSFRESDIIARIGGDEFAVLVTNLPAPALKSIIARHLEDNLALHNEVAQRDYQLSFSVGFEFYTPETPCSVEELLARADARMYENKKAKNGELSHTRPKDAYIEKRSYPRYHTGEKCWATLDGSDRRAVQNVSRGGICLKTTRKHSPESVYQIDILDHRGKEITVKGVVVWSSPVEASVTDSDNSLLFETGLKFLDLKGSQRKSMITFVSHLAG